VARQAAVVAALAGTIAVNGLANALPLNGRTTGSISDQFPLKITPPGYVFAIWGLIYGGLIGYAIYQALPAQRDNERLRRMAWPFVLSCAANVAWLFLWHYGQYRLTLGAMIGLLLSLITINLRGGRSEPAPLAEKLLARLPFSIYLGWISVATIINVCVALYDAGWDGAPLSDQQWTAGLIGTAGALAAIMGLGRRDAGFPLVIAWALAGVATKQAGDPLLASSAWAAVATSVTAAAGALIRPRR
jgi:tryptophan-rich sensory protein